MDQIRVELGYGLLGLLNSETSRKLTDHIKTLRKQMAQEIGLILPSVRIIDNIQLPSQFYVIRVKDWEAGRGELRPEMALIIDPRGEPITMEGEDTNEPTFGLPAKWIAASQRDEAERLGYTVVDPATVLTTHLTEVVKDNLSELLSFADTQRLLEQMDEPYKKLLNDLVPGQVSLGGVQRILQNLVSERVSIRDLPSILEALSEACSFTRNLSMMTEHVRQRLARQITFSNTDPTGTLGMVTFSVPTERMFLDALDGEGEVKNLALAPTQLQEFIATLRTTLDKVSLLHDVPVLVTSPTLRPYVRTIVERIRPSTPVLSQAEVHPKATLKTLGQV
jgi:flagellar biosynthesis protein FlhA